MKIFLLTISILFLSATVYAQKVVEPVRIVIKTQGADELTDAVRAELRRLGNVALVSRDADFEIHLNGKRIPAGACRGVAGAVLIVRRSDGLHALTVYTGGDFGELAAFIAQTINAENFSEFRSNALRKRK
jgi:hypothetical protein